MGMMATVMNGLVLRDSFLSLGFKSNVLSSIAIQGIVETYDRSLANSYLSKNHIVVFVAGTGNPFFSTDSAASLRGIEVKSEILLKATKVDGVYSADPKIDKNAKFFKRLTYNEVIERQLGVMDTSAFAMCRDYQLPIRVFNMYKSGILKDIVLGADEGTLIGARLEA